MGEPTSTVSALEIDPIEPMRSGRTSLDSDTRRVLFPTRLSRFRAERVEQGVDVGRGVVAVG
jgi:hypothetical protein